jgi:hypothetical protein
VFDELAVLEQEQWAVVHEPGESVASEGRERVCRFRHARVGGRVLASGPGQPSRHGGARPF